MKRFLEGKSTWQRIAMLLLMGALVIALAACDDDDDDDNGSSGTDDDDTTVTHSCELADAVTETVTENQICFVAGDEEPIVYESGVEGGAFTVSYNTDTEVTSAETDLDDPIDGFNLVLDIAGNTAATYDSDDGDTNFELYEGCDDAETDDTQCTSISIPNVYSIYTVSDCSGDGIDSVITYEVTEFGAVGEQVRGTFEGLLVEYTFFPDHSINCSNNFAISGTFSVERGADTTP